MGHSAWSQLIGLVSDEAVYSALWGLKLTNMPYGHTCGHAKGKNHARERVGSSDLECPLVHDFLEKPCEVHLESGYHRRHQHCSIPGNYVISSYGAIHLLVVTLNASSRKNYPSFTICQR